MGKQSKNRAKVLRKAMALPEPDYLGTKDFDAGIEDLEEYIKNETEKQTQELKNQSKKHNEDQMAEHNKTQTLLGDLNGKMDQVTEEKAKHAEEMAKLEAKLEAKHAEEKAKLEAQLERKDHLFEEVLIQSAKKGRLSVPRFLISNDDDSSMGNTTLASKSTCSEKEKELMRELQKKDLEVKDRDEQIRLFHAPDVMDIHPVEQTQQSERQGKALQTHYDNHSKARLKKASMLPPRTPSKRRTRSSYKASD